jgi:hypothetical protein
VTLAERDRQVAAEEVRIGFVVADFFPIRASE